MYVPGDEKCRNTCTNSLTKKWFIGISLSAVRVTEISWTPLADVDRHMYSLPSRKSLTGLKTRSSVCSVVSTTVPKLKTHSSLVTGRSVEQERDVESPTVREVLPAVRRPATAEGEEEEVDREEEKEEEEEKRREKVKQRNNKTEKDKRKKNKTRKGAEDRYSDYSLP